MPRAGLIPHRQPFIDGKFVPGAGQPLPVEDPATEEVFAEVEGCDVAQIEEAIVAARNAFDRGPWSRASRHERAEVVRRMADALDRDVEALLTTVIAEVGSSRMMVEGIQVKVAINQIREIADLYLSLPEEEHNPRPLADVVSAGKVAVSMVRYEPIGVVSAISAYNFPFWISTWKTIPALIAGNSVVLRPSPLTPLSVLALAAAADSAGLPPGVLNVVMEQGVEGSQLMTTHPAVDQVTFTGSTGVGKLIAAQAAATLKRVTLELGGKSAQIYLPDAVDRAAMGCMTVFAAHAGQGCVLPTRVLVPEASKAEVVERAAEIAGSLKVGNPAEPGITVGPVISAAQVDRCADYVARAVAAGARVAAGGGRPAHLPKGHYFEPTVLDVDDNSNPAAQDEIFGPVVCIIGYRDIDHAIAIANDTVYGLSGYVHSADVQQATEIAKRLRSGAVNINGGAFSTYAPSGGYKQSGLGRERGPQGIREYQEVKHIAISNA